MRQELYVKEIPKCCEDCPVHNGTNGICKLLHKYTYDTPPKDCPIKSLHEHDKELVKKVCKKISNRLFKYYKTADIILNKNIKHNDARIILSFDVDLVLEQIQKEFEK